MALSQIQCLSDNHVNLRTHESKPEFLYCEEQRLALESFLREGLEEFEKYLQAHGVRGFLSNLELERLSGALEPYNPGSETQQADSDSDEPPLSLQYWPDLSDCSFPQLDLGWPDCVSYRGVTRVNVIAQPPMDGQAHIKEIIRKTIAQAQKVIAVVMDVFTDVDIFRDLLDAAFKRKVSVYILLERTSLPHFLSMCERADMHKGHLKSLRVCVTGGVEFHTRSCTKVPGRLGHRFMFVDGDRAFSGSYSFTWTASRLDRHLITQVTGQAVEAFDRLFRDLYVTSCAVSLRKVATRTEPQPEPLPPAAPVAPPSAEVARKLINPKYALVTASNSSPTSSSNQNGGKNSNSQNPALPESRKHKGKAVKQEVEAPPLHPGLAHLEKAYLIPYLPVWPEPDPSSDVIGFINVRDATRPSHVHLQRSERFETSQAIRFSSPLATPRETLPEVAQRRRVSVPTPEPDPNPKPEPTEPNSTPCQGRAAEPTPGSDPRPGQTAGPRVDASHASNTEHDGTAKRLSNTQIPQAMSDLDVRTCTDSSHRNPGPPVPKPRTVQLVISDSLDYQEVRVVPRTAPHTCIATLGTSGPVPETSKPIPVTSGPVPETSKPTPLTSGLVPETSKSATETSIPLTETSKPSPDASEPVPEISKPSPDTGRPEAETSKSTTETIIPVTETSKPSPDTGRPEAETSKSRTETIIPVTETSKPSPGTSKPVPETSKPSPDTSGPEAETNKATTEPTSGPVSCKPLPGTNGPVAETRMPKPATTCPAYSKSSPGTNKPVPVSGKPTPGTIGPVPGTRKPSSVTGGPAQETSKPTPATIGPEEENSKPTPATSGPVSGEPSPSSSGPVPVSGKPTPGTIGPVPETRKPTPTTSGPVTETSKSATETSGPVSGKPSTGTSGPVPKSGKPTPETIGPVPDTSKPTPATSGPVTEVCKSTTGTDGPVFSKLSPVNSGPETSKPLPATSGPGPDTSGERKEEKEVETSHTLRQTDIETRTTQPQKDTSRHSARETTDDPPASPKTSGAATQQVKTETVQVTPKATKGPQKDAGTTAAALPGGREDTATPKTIKGPRKDAGTKLQPQAARETPPCESGTTAPQREGTVAAVPPGGREDTATPRSAGPETAAPRRDSPGAASSTAPQGVLTETQTGVSTTTSAARTTARAAHSATRHPAATASAPLPPPQRGRVEVEATTPGGDTPAEAGPSQVTSGEPAGRTTPSPGTPAALTPEARSLSPAFRSCTPASDGSPPSSFRADSVLSTTSEEYFECSGSPLPEVTFDPGPNDFYAAWREEEEVRDASYSNASYSNASYSNATIIQGDSSTKDASYSKATLIQTDIRPAQVNIMAMPKDSGTPNINTSPDRSSAPTSTGDRPQVSGTAFKNHQLPIDANDADAKSSDPLSGTCATDMPTLATAQTVVIAAGQAVNQPPHPNSNVVPEPTASSLATGRTTPTTVNSATGHTIPTSLTSLTDCNTPTTLTSAMGLTTPTTLTSAMGHTTPTTLTSATDRTTPTTLISTTDRTTPTTLTSATDRTTLFQANGHTTPGSATPSPTLLFFTPTTSPSSTPSPDPSTAAPWPASPPPSPGRAATLVLPSSTRGEKREDGAEERHGDTESEPEGKGQERPNQERPNQERPVGQPLKEVPDSTLAQEKMRGPEEGGPEENGQEKALSVNGIEAAETPAALGPCDTERRTGGQQAAKGADGKKPLRAPPKPPVRGLHQLFQDSQGETSGKRPQPRAPSPGRASKAHRPGPQQGPRAPGPAGRSRPSLGNFPSLERTVGPRRPLTRQAPPVPGRRLSDGAKTPVAFHHAQAQLNPQPFLSGYPQGQASSLGKTPFGLSFSRLYQLKGLDRMNCHQPLRRSTSNPSPTQDPKTEP